MKKFTRKFTAVFILLALSAGILSACGEGTGAYELYRQMMTVMNNVESIDMDISVTLDMIMDGEAVNTVSTGNIKQVIRSETDIDMVMNLDMVAEDMSMPMTMYFTGGVLYMETVDVMGMTLRDRMAMSLEDAMNMAHGVEVLDFPENAIKDFSISNQGGGSRKIEFSLDGGALTALTEQAMVWIGQLEDIGMYVEDFSIEIGDVTCEIVISSSGMLQSYRMVAQIDINMTVDGENTSMSMNMDTSMTVNSYNDVTVTFPDDLDEWEATGMLF